MGAKRPSERTHRIKADEELNLTSFMDIITNLMFFLLLFANLIPVVIIDAPLPKIARTADEVRVAKEQEKDLEVVVRITPNGLTVQSILGRKRFVAKSAGEFPLTQFHQFLVSLHSKRPKSRAITIVPTDSVKYDSIIKVMDASREYVQGDPGFKELPPEIVGKPEGLQFNRLFSDVSFGGV